MFWLLLPPFEMVACGAGQRLVAGRKGHAGSTAKDRYLVGRHVGLCKKNAHNPVTLLGFWLVIENYFPGWTVSAVSTSIEAVKHLDPSQYVKEVHVT